MSTSNPKNSTTGNEVQPSRIVIAYHACRIILAILFMAAAIPKILMPWDFGRAILAYEILPGYLISPMGITMPWVELAAGIFLLFNRMVRPSAILVALMNIIFILAIISVMVRGMDIECGCAFEFGPLKTIVGTEADGWALVRDFIFLGMAAYVYINHRPKRITN